MDLIMSAELPQERKGVQSGADAGAFVAARDESSTRTEQQQKEVKALRRKPDSHLIRDDTAFKAAIVANYDKDYEDFVALLGLHLEKPRFEIVLDKPKDENSMACYKHNENKISVFPPWISYEQRYANAFREPVQHELIHAAHFQLNKKGYSDRYATEVIAYCWDALFGHEGEPVDSICTDISLSITFKEILPKIDGLFTALALFEKPVEKKVEAIRALLMATPEDAQSMLVVLALEALHTYERIREEKKELGLAEFNPLQLVQYWLHKALADGSALFL